MNTDLKGSSVKACEGLAVTKKLSLSMLDVWSISLGCMVGWGAFVMPGTTFLPVAGPLGSVIAVFAGIILNLVKSFVLVVNSGRVTELLFSSERQLKVLMAVRQRVL